MMGKHPHHPMVRKELRQALITILTPETTRKGITTLDIQMFISIIIMFLNTDVKHGIKNHVPFCGFHNHTFSKCWKRMAAHERMRRERPSQQQVKQIWRNKMYSSHCDINGHQRATCWRLHPEKRFKDKALVHEPGETIVRQAKPP